MQNVIDDQGFIVSGRDSGMSRRNSAGLSGRGVRGRQRGRHPRQARDRYAQGHHRLAATAGAEPRRAALRPDPAASAPSLIF